MDYLNVYREMISLRGLTDHTVKSYSTYIRSYLDYLHTLLHKQPEDVSWDELRDFIRWLQKERALSDRTINHCISQLRFFTMYVLHKPWDPTQLPMRKFDSFLPFVPTQKEAELFISTLSDLKPKAMVALMYSAGLRGSPKLWLLSCILPVSGLGKSAVSVTVISNGKICGSISHIQKTVQTAMPSFLKKRWISSLTTGLHTAVPPAGFFRNRRILPGLLILFISRGICVPTKSPSAGNTGLPATPAYLPLFPSCFRNTPL